jgi:hypothetical protein
MFCGKELRRSQDINGIDYIEVSSESLNAQRFINVYFLKDPSPLGLESSPGSFRIEGGVRIRNIQVLSVRNADDHLIVEVDRAGDFSNYVLVINSPHLDPAYSQCDFNFKAGCPSRFDCKPRQVCPVKTGPQPNIDYMAKDYASFRQALIDLIPSLTPDWKERHEADLGMTLLELMAYAGDQLSYYQDSVANEAYLKTARQRISVRRHVSLIDYRMHDGVSARTFVHFRVASKGTIPKGTQLLTRIDVPIGGASIPPGVVISADKKEMALALADVVFETFEDLAVSKNLNEIPIYTWFDQKCCLPQGSTTADLLGDLTEELKPGDLILFEEVMGPSTGISADADKNHRQVVRIKDVQLTYDPIGDPATNLPQAITRISWDRKDALTFSLCISSIYDDGSPMKGVSLARGNIAIADHGRSIEGESHPGPKKPLYSSQYRPHRFLLNRGPLSFRLEPDGIGSASDLQATDSHLARPQIHKLMIAAIPEPWEVALPNLMNSGPFDRHFVVEPDNEGRAMIRFGDGEYGMALMDYEEGSDSASNENLINVSYRIGIGAVGNVGCESLVHIIDPETEDWPEFEESSSEIKPVRNPLPAWGGIDPEPMEKVKQIAPAAFHADQLRAVTEEDYALAAEKCPEVSKAVATFRWTGSWHTVFVTIDPSGGVELTAELKLKVKNWIYRFTQAGYDLEINGPIFVPLEIEAEICVDPYHFRGDVEKAVMTALCNRILPDGGHGFFHPDNFTFGQSIYLSRIYAAIDAVEGVRSSNVTVFKKFGKLANFELERGYITMGRLEVVRLDNDLNFPENGVLRLVMKGGK